LEIILYYLRAYFQPFFIRRRRSVSGYTTEDEGEKNGERMPQGI